MGSRRPVRRSPTGWSPVREGKMDDYNRDLRALLDLVTETANAHDRTTQDMLIDMGVLQDGREEDAEAAFAGVPA